MRMIGRRFQLSVRIVPEDRFNPIKCAVSRFDKYPRNCAVLNDVGALRRHAFVVVCKSPEPGTMLEPRIRHHIHDVRAVAQLVQLDPASENSSPRNSLPRPARDRARSDAPPTHESAIPAGSRPKSAFRFSADTAPPNAAPPLPRATRGACLHQVQRLHQLIALPAHAARQNCSDTTASEFRRF